MGEIINFNNYVKKRNNKQQKVKEFYRVDFGVSKRCCNIKSYGVICLKCGQCGRKFTREGVVESD